jgi:hypothetical protein
MFETANEPEKQRTIRNECERESPHQSTCRYHKIDKWMIDVVCLSKDDGDAGWVVNDDKRAKPKTALPQWNEKNETEKEKFT